jgi:hypothetical protein
MPRDRTRAAYRRLLRLYPRSFRERFGDSMQQTFDDLRRDQRATGDGMPGFLVRTFLETSLGVARENLSALSRTQLAPHHRHALAGLVLFSPIGVLFPALWLEIAAVHDLLTLDGGRPNVVGWTLIGTGFLLLPVALVVTLLPMIRRGPDDKRRLYPVNLLVCAVIAIPLAMTLYGIGDELYRCDIRGIPNCD